MTFKNMTHNIDNIYKKILKVINNGNLCLHVEILRPIAVSTNSKHNKSHNTRKTNTNTNIKKCKHFFKKYSSIAMKCLDFLPFNMATIHILIVVSTLKFLHLFLLLHLT